MAARKYAKLKTPPSDRAVGDLIEAVQWAGVHQLAEICVFAEINCILVPIEVAASGAAVWGEIVAGLCEKTQKQIGYFRDIQAATLSRQRVQRPFGRLSTHQLLEAGAGAV